jgi:hypothetical protein
MGKGFAFLGAAATLMLHSGQAMACDPDIKWAPVAQKLIRQVSAMALGERAVILYNSNKNPDLIREMRDEIRFSSGVLLAEWPRATKRGTEAKLAMPRDKAELSEDREDAAYRLILKETDVLFWLDSGNPSDRPKRWEKLLAGSPRTRSIHFHWFEPELESDRCAVFNSYIVAMDYPKAQLASLQRQAITLLKGSTAQITNAAGTALTLQIPANARIGMNDGELGRAEASRARSTRDKEEEFPASAIRTTNAKVDGVLVARSMFRDPKTLFRLTFANSRLVGIEGPAADVAEIRDVLAKTKGAHFAELVIGLNPKLDKFAPSGWPLYYASGGGMVQIRIGDNWESGGANRAPKHWQDMFILSDANVATEGRQLLNQGNIALRP